MSYTTIQSVPVEQFLAGDLIRLSSCGWQSVENRAVVGEDEFVRMWVRFLGLEYAQEIVCDLEERFDCMREQK